MSDYGMLVLNEYGQTRLSITDRTFRLVDVFVVGQNLSGSKYIPGILSKGCFVFCSTYNVSLTGTFALPHYGYTSGDYVYYQPTPSSNVSSGPSIIWVYATT